MSFFTATTDWVDGFLWQLLAFGLRATVILAAAWGATALLRRASAATRHMIWTSAIAGVLALPVITAAIPAWRVPIASIDAGVDSPSLTTPQQTKTVQDAAVASAINPAVKAPVAGGPAVAAPPAAARSELSIGERVRPHISARGVTIGLWLTLAILLLARLAVATTRLSTWQRASRPVEDPAWLALVRQLTRNYGIERPVVLLENAETDVPVTWGIVYPVILLPADAEHWDEEQRIAVLTHELAHVKRFDALSQLLGQITLALLWFHPLVWMAVRRMRLEREHACDDFVLVAGARASRYADDLLGLARRLSRPTAPAAAALAMARRSELEGRLLAILDPALKRTAVRRARVALLTLAVLVLATPLAAFTPSARVREQDRAVVVSPAAPAIHQSIGSGRQPTATNAPRSVADPARDTVTLPAHETADSTTSGAADSTTRAAADSSSDPGPQRLSLKELAMQLGISEPAQAAGPASSRARPDTEPVQRVDLQTLIDVTRATKRMSSDYDKAQILAQIAKRYQPDDALRDAYLDVVFSMSSDYERGNALVALLSRDSLPLASTAQVLRSAKLMSSDASRATVLKRINPATFADSTVQRAYLDVIISMSSNTERANAISSLVKQRPLTPITQLGLVRAIALMSSNTEKGNVLLLFLDNQGIAHESVRRAFIKAAETLSSDSDYRRVMGAVLR